ncbi:MAG: hypothetical protein WC052_06230 [Patescibacteria group bacterium]
MNRYRVRLTNSHFSNVTLTVEAETKAEAETIALYARHGFRVHWSKRVAAKTKPTRHHYGLSPKTIGVGTSTAKAY